MIPEYPEHEKMRLVSDKSQIIGEFLDHMPWTLAEWEGDNLVPVWKTINQLLAEYFGIDLELIEQEKQQMLEFQRQINQRKEVR